MIKSVVREYRFYASIKPVVVNSITCQRDIFDLCFARVELICNSNIADPCLYAPPGYTYGMPGHSCRAYWKCVHGTSLATCCHQNTSYIDSLGCFNSPECDQECPPKAPMDMCGEVKFYVDFYL